MRCKYNSHHCFKTCI